MTLDSAPPADPASGRRSRFAIGIDLGGTKIAGGIFEAAGKLHGGLETVPTEASGPRERTIENLLGLVARRLEAARAAGIEIEGIGVGSTGPLDPGAGVLEPDTIPGLHGFRLREAVQARAGFDVRLTNDGNAFALAEALYGAGKGHTIVVGVTLGTGCGCGIVIEGRILEGATANTGELYLAPVAGSTFDRVLSGTGLERRYRERTGRAASGAEVTRLADAGDRAAIEAFADFGRDVGQGLGIIAAVVDPGAIVLGGSVARALQHFARTMREEVQKHVAPQAAARLCVVPAALGEASGALGGAALVFSGGTIR